MKERQDYALALPLGVLQSAANLSIIMIAGGNHTFISLSAKLTERVSALSAACGGTSPKGRGKCLVLSFIAVC